jgi:hypothetical protein
MTFLALCSARFSLRAILAATLCAGVLVACDNNKDTVIVDGLDCGLVRADLTGTWVVNFTIGSTVTTNCDNIGKNNTPVNVSNTPITFTNVDAFASPSGASFDAIGAGPDLSNELLASIEADSCLALVQIWNNTSKSWIQCLGTLDLASRTIPAFCDSADLDTNVPVDGSPDVACDLAQTLTVFISTP